MELLDYASCSSYDLPPSSALHASAPRIHLLCVAVLTIVEKAYRENGFSRSPKVIGGDAGYAMQPVSSICVSVTRVMAMGGFSVERSPGEFDRHRMDNVNPTTALQRNRRLLYLQEAARSAQSSLAGSHGLSRS
jgi:hypothetical protein